MNLTFIWLITDHIPSTLSRKLTNCSISISIRYILAVIKSTEACCQPKKVTAIVSRVAGTMVVRSSSVRAVAHSNLSQVPPLHLHVGK